jgi:hypothetical protein
LRITKSILPPEDARGCQLSFFRVVERREDGRGESAGKDVGKSYVESIVWGFGGVPAVNISILINMK